MQKESGHRLCEVLPTITYEQNDMSAIDVVAYHLATDGLTTDVPHLQCHVDIPYATAHITTDIRSCGENSARLSDSVCESRERNGAR